MLRLRRGVYPIRLRDCGETVSVESTPRLNASQVPELVRMVRRMFRLDEDFSAFYATVENETALQWISKGAGRMMASPSVFEDVIKTVCTTNCAWSGTVRMVRALVDGLGGGAFPAPLQMAQAPQHFYRDVARAGYRGAYLRELARLVHSGEVDLENLRPTAGLSDEAVEEALLRLPGIGPYACAHILLLLGRYHRLVLDSWTRPTYLRLTGKKRSSDRSIQRSFRRYGNYAGLTFWLFLTRHWLD